ncbi:SDR family oxidoreductase [Kineococcus sp. NUM-3379]
MVERAGRRVLVTGGGTGIGRAIALELARAGADVAVTYRTHDAAPVVAQVEALGRRGAAFALDVTDAAQVPAVVARAAEFLGGIDVLVNNAGGLVERRPVEGIDEEFFRHVLDLNLVSAFSAVRAVLPHMPDGGRIVSISSLAGQNGGGAGAVPYATSKAALDGLTRALAKELAPRRITVNSVAPGFITDTPFHERFTPEAARRESVARIPLGRAGEPEDVAAAVAFLVSERGGFCTGTVVDVNGGAWVR